MESDGFVAAPKTTSTVIPIREEIRLRRFWFFHHDLRAFTTSVRVYVNFFTVYIYCRSVVSCETELAK